MDSGKSKGQIIEERQNRNKVACEKVKEDTIKQVLEVSLSKGTKKD